MSVQPIGEDFVPYASANSVVLVIKQYRNRGLPEPLTSAGLEQIGAAPSMAHFALRALVFLGLIDESGHIKEEFTRLRRAASDDYPSILAEIIKKAYLSVFNVVDPAVDDARRIDDAFRAYEPAKQRKKMVALFMGLCEEAAILPSGTAKRRNTPGSTSRPRRGRQTPPQSAPTPEAPPPQAPPPPTPEGLHSALVGLIADLPTKGPKWSTVERNRWLAAFENNLNYAYPVENQEERGE